MEHLPVYEQAEQQKWFSGYRRLYWIDTVPKISAVFESYLKRALNSNAFA
jgi:hypothetical protein